MLKKIKIEDIDNVMELWKEEVSKSKIPSKNKLILEKYTKIRERFIENINSTILYTEDGIIEGFISVNKDDEIWIVLVKSNIRREGIGTILLNSIKKRKKRLITKISCNDEKALAFFDKNGFYKIEEDYDEITKSKEYILEWKKQENKKIAVVYFDNDIEKEVISKNKNSIVDFKNINVKQFIKSADNKKAELNDIKTYMKLRKIIEETLKNEKILLYIDYNNYYEFLDEQIKEISKIQKVDLNIVICEPLTIENAKKINCIKQIENVYKDYRIYKIDCSLSKEKDITLNQIFYKRQELLVDKIEEIAKNIK